LVDDSIARLDERVKMLEANHDDIKKLIVQTSKLEQKIDDMAQKITSLCEIISEMNNELDCIKIVIERHNTYFKILGTALMLLFAIVANLIIRFA